MNETMLSTLIAHLTELLTEHGDMPVYTSTITECYNTEWQGWQDWNSLELKISMTIDGSDQHKVCILYH